MVKPSLCYHQVSFCLHQHHSPLLLYIKRSAACRVLQNCAVKISIILLQWTRPAERFNDGQTVIVLSSSQLLLAPTSQPVTPVHQAIRGVPLGQRKDLRMVKPSSCYHQVSFCLHQHHSPLLLYIKRFAACRVLQNCAVKTSIILLQWARPAERFKDGQTVIVLSSSQLLLAPTSQPVTSVHQAIRGVPCVTELRSENIYYIATMGSASGKI
ncbi:hypothetical protein J6590_070429 [Homalodisca vitripennis]|nr:hypothetical protein J6590_070429 [Homalodisca vitripennis]